MNTNFHILLTQIWHRAKQLLVCFPRLANGKTSTAWESESIAHYKIVRYVSCINRIFVVLFDIQSKLHFNLNGFKTF